MSLPKLYLYQQRAFDLALTIPRHFIYGPTGYGTRTVQAYIALDWNAVVIAPKILHPHWRELGAGRIYSPQYINKHPEVVAEALVIDVMSGHFTAVYRLARKAKKLSIRKHSFGNNYIIPLPIGKGHI